MKRRAFLSTASTVGVVGAVSGTTIISSTYSSISTSLLLEEFTSTSKSILDRFKIEVSSNIEKLGLDQKFADLVAMPVQIIDKKTIGGYQAIQYRNRAGDFVTISTKEGIERIEISQS